MSAEKFEAYLLCVVAMEENLHEHRTVRNAM
jgi:hypothetical protein